MAMPAKESVSSVRPNFEAALDCRLAKSATTAEAESRTPENIITLANCLGLRADQCANSWLSTNANSGIDGKVYPGSFDFEMLKNSRQKRAVSQKKSCR